METVEKLCFLNAHNRNNIIVYIYLHMIVTKQANIINVQTSAMNVMND